MLYMMNRVHVFYHQGNQCETNLITYSQLETSEPNLTAMVFAAKDRRLDLHFTALDRIYTQVIVIVQAATANGIPNYGTIKVTWE